MRQAAAGTMLLTLLVGGAIEAQDPEPTPPPVELSDARLEAFAEVYIAVQEIGQELQAELSEVTGDPEEQDRLQEQYNAQMVEAIREREFAIREYRRIVDTINDDEELRARFIEIVTALQEEPEP